jgi:hypothetical protein
MQQGMRMNHLPFPLTFNGKEKPSVLDFFLI